MGFADFCEEWVRSYGQEKLEVNTLKTYRMALNNHILPMLGKMRLDQINTMQLNALLNQTERKDKQSGGLSANTRLYLYNVLNSVFQRAVEWNLLKISPMKGVTRPKLVKQKHDVYDQQDLHKLLAALEQESLNWKLYVLLAIETGLRHGEMLALTWNHVNLENRTISVSGSLIYDKGPVVKATKNVSSTRQVSFREAFLPLLQKFYTIMCEVKKDLGERWAEQEKFYLFCNYENGQPLYPSTPTNWFGKFIKRHKLKQLRLHDLRHIHATWLILNGVPLKVVSERLGHSNIGTTSDIYAHVLPTADKAAAETLNSVFSSEGIAETIC